MSSPLAIAGATLVLRNLLDNALVEAGASGFTGNKVKVTSLPPDAITVEGSNAETQLNLFLHEVTFNQGWRNEGLPSRDAGGRRLSNPPLALDLHYLLTAYGAEELHAEILLGYAMSVLHEHPVLDRDTVRDALTGGSLDVSMLPPAFQALNLSDLADQVELMKVTPAARNSEEMSRLWSALQARYRPTACYQVSVVLIDSRRAVRAALPVLSRGPVDPTLGRERGITASASLRPPFPTLTAVHPPRGEVAAILGETVVFEGSSLDGLDHLVRFEHPRLDAPIELAPVATPTATRLEVTLPDDVQASSDWPAGAWSVSVSVRRPEEVAPRRSNALVLLLAPALRLGPGETEAERGPVSGEVTVHLRFQPHARPGQRLILQVGGFEAPGPSIPTATDTADFVFPSLAAGVEPVRLRIDGVDSRLIDGSTTPPSFDATQRLVVPL